MQAKSIVIRLLVCIADFEDLGSRNTFGVGEIRSGHQRATQRDRVHNAQKATDCADGHCRPVGETVPPADNNQAGEDEDHCGKSSCSRCNRLDDVVFLDGVIGEKP